MTKKAHDTDQLPAAPRERGRPTDGGLAAVQAGRASVRLGRGFAAEAEVAVTPAGILAIGAMVGMILLGSAVIVNAARR